MITGMGTNYLDGLPPSTERANTIPSSQSDDGDELWLKILQEVSNKNNNAVRSSLIILGLFLLIFYFVLNFKEMNVLVNHP